MHTDSCYFNTKLIDKWLFNFFILIWQHWHILQKFVVSPERKADQVNVDKQLIEVIKKRDDKKLMFGYLKSDFSLKNHQYPHNMIF